MKFVRIYEGKGQDKNDCYSELKLQPKFAFASSKYVEEIEYDNS